MRANERQLKDLLAENGSIFEHGTKLGLIVDGAEVPVKDCGDPLQGLLGALQGELGLWLKEGKMFLHSSSWQNFCQQVTNCLRNLDPDNVDTGFRPFPG